MGPLAEQAPEDIVAIVESNVLGTMLCEWRVLCALGMLVCAGLCAG